MDTMIQSHISNHTPHPTSSRLEDSLDRLIAQQTLYYEQQNQANAQLLAGLQQLVEIMQPFVETLSLHEHASTLSQKPDNLPHTGSATNLPALKLKRTTVTSMSVDHMQHLLAPTTDLNPVRYHLAPYFQNKIVPPVHRPTRHQEPILQPAPPISIISVN